MSTDTQLQTVVERVEAFLADHDPKSMDDREFRGARFDAGLAWVHFPEGLGGLGFRPDLNREIEKRMRSAGAAAADPTSFFQALAGPTIVTHGSEEQKRRFLRPMFTGEERWCQLFSEPGAGSDFAGLATRAVRDGDEWIVNGQKVWNTLAHLADWGMLVTRTDPESPKHRGMTYFAVDMRAPGVEVRPLRQITGEAEFNEVYLTDTRIPDDQRIGAEGEGWRVALTTLMNERTAIGSGGAGSSKPVRGGPANDAVRIWADLDATERTETRKARLMELWVRGEVARLTNLRAAESLRTGNPGPEGSVAKLEFANLNKELYDFCIDLLGAAGMVDYDYTFRRPTELDATGASKSPQYAFLRVRANSIEGGTSEILKNIIGEQVLGLPGEPRVDKDLPWIKVPRS
ncbi:MAG: acyl-CoA dehydrogenase family protein [Ilumatobacteraceae bacterium]|jgi:alkylation response protein AidB-like acyl-CoA dehydrogenase|nr:acyl-CoA dehydrogenase family protein [Ilumatobacteraceae bacterium]MBL6760758.1 acyl-CoA dehydrogenase family protein [Ilumatobacteraceae bacterium]MDA2973506.1 acyl-CoA dehydrogenase family protein [Actinomycetota bacterium]